LGRYEKLRRERFSVETFRWRIGTGKILKPSSFLEVCKSEKPECFLVLGVQFPAWDIVPEVRLTSVSAPRGEPGIGMRLGQRCGAQNQAMALITDELGCAEQFGTVFFQGLPGVRIPVPGLALLRAGNSVGQRYRKPVVGGIRLGRVRHFPGAPCHWNSRIGLVSRDKRRGTFGRSHRDSRLAISRRGRKAGCGGGFTEGPLRMDEAIVKQNDNDH